MTQAFNILLVDDDPRVISVLGAMLQQFGQLRFATTGADALRAATQKTPDLILLDIEMPGMSGFEVCAAMKAIPSLAEVPVIFITSHDSAEHEVAGLDLGAADFLAKPPRAALVTARVRMHLRMKQMADALRAAASTDALTGVANRRHFDEALAREWAQARRHGTQIALLMVDVDHFKLYNDRYGHPAGDRCLKAVAQALRTEVHRPGDLVARYGGEEFAVLLPHTDAAGARFLAPRLLHAVESLAIPHEASPLGRHVSLSIGVAAGCPVGDGDLPVDSRFGDLLPRRAADDLLAAADQALYAAKEAGRRQARFLSLADVGLPSRAGLVRQLAALPDAEPATR